MQNKLGLKRSIFLSITFMVGTGIFIKMRILNGLSHNSTAPIVVLFLLFALGMSAFVYVLSKIIPAQTDDMGFVGWSHKFCSRTIHSATCRFIRHLYYPLSLLVFSVYAILGFTGEQLGIFSTLILAFVLVFFLMVLNWVSFAWSQRIQTILFGLITIPLFILPILAFLSPGSRDPTLAVAPPKPTVWSKSSSYDATGLSSVGPWMCLISGLPSLLFIYDGFYNMSSLKSKLKNPKHLKYVVLSSMGLITFIYLFAIIGFSVGDPNTANFRRFRILAGSSFFVDLFEILISLASVLTLNSIIMGSVPQLEAMSAVHKFEDEISLRRRIFYKRRHKDEELERKFSIFCLVMAKTFGFFVAVGLVLFYSIHLQDHGEPVEIVNGLADIITLFVFLVLIAIIRGRRNHCSERKFIICSRVCVFMILMALGYMVLSDLVGLSGYGGSNPVNSAFKLFMVIMFFVVCFRENIRIFMARIIGRKEIRMFPEYPEGSTINLG